VGAHPMIKPLQATWKDAVGGCPLGLGVRAHRSETALKGEAK